MRKVLRKIRSNRINIGFIIFLMALAITNLLAALMDRDMSGLSNVLMLVGLLCLIEKKSLLKIKIIKGNYLLCFLFTLYCILMAWFSGYSFTQGSGAIIYSIFALILMYVLSMNSYWECEDDFVRILFHASGLLSFLCAWVLTDGFTDLSSHVNSIYSSAGEVISNRLTLSTIPVMCILTCIIHKPQKITTVLLKYIYVFLSILCLLIVFRRSSTVSLMITLVLHIFYSVKKAKKHIDYKHLTMNFMSIAALIAVVVILYRIPFIKEGIGNLMESINKAVLSLFGNDIFGVDESANIRYRIRNQILKEYNSYNIVQILFGMGYMYRYLDFPVFQAFIDMGIFGGLIFSYLQIGVPVKNIFNSPVNELDEFIKLYSIFGLMESFYSGIPYGYNRYIFVLMILFFQYSNRNTANAKNRTIGRNYEDIIC